MKKALVTGAAGFIGSHLCESLIEKGMKVIGIDSFTDYYPRAQKESNLARLRYQENFSFLEADLNTCQLNKILADVEYVFHLAAQPGVRGSWGKNFEIYIRNNVLATQKLLEACKESAIERFIYASSSSVYGDTPDLPMQEESILKPYSPYGVTKLAAENLCYLYWQNYKLPVVIVRYFTVYGPRQRPDMAFHRFIKAAFNNQPIRIFGNGEQTRDFTYVADAVEGTILSISSPPGKIYNLGSGSQTSVKQVIKILEDLLKTEIETIYQEDQKGDVKHTLADITSLKRLGYQPKINLKSGLQAEINWFRESIL